MSQSSVRCSYHERKRDPRGNFGFLTATHTPPGHSPTEWEGQQKPRHSLNHHLDASAPPPRILSGPCGVLSGALLSRADWHCTWAPGRKGQDRTGVCRRPRDPYPNVAQATGGGPSVTADLSSLRVDTQEKGEPLALLGMGSFIRCAVLVLGGTRLSLGLPRWREW